MHNGVIYFVFQINLVVMFLNFVYANDLVFDVSVDLFHFIRASEWRAELEC
jgi:hypothetical protein